MSRYFVGDYVVNEYMIGDSGKLAVMDQMLERQKKKKKRNNKPRASVFFLGGGDFTRELEFSSSVNTFKYSAPRLLFGCFS